MIKIIIGDRTRPTPSPERVSWNVKFFFCGVGTFNAVIATFMAFGPWWAKVASAVGFIMAALSFHTAYKEHKNPFYKD